MDRAFSVPESKSTVIQTDVDGFPTPYIDTRLIVASTLGPIDGSDTATDLSYEDRTEAVPSRFRKWIMKPILVRTVLTSTKATTK